MLKDKINPYAPCYCGSGSKYRFCCMKRDQLVNDNLEYLDQTTPEAKASMEVFHAADEAMSKHDFKAAMPLFQRAYELFPVVPSPLNNLAICHLLQHEFAEALRVQRQAVTEMKQPNSFGVANLATLLYFNGEDEAGLNAAYVATTLAPFNEQVILKICEALAHYRCHSDILEVALSADFLEIPDLAFFTGCAAANLGDLGQASTRWGMLPMGSQYAPLVQKYLEWLRKYGKAKTIRGDWPYFRADDYPLRVPDGEADPMLRSRWLVDFVEAAVNDGSTKSGKVLSMLSGSTHPAAVELLRLIMNGAFGTEKLRLQASTMLLEKGVLKSGEHIHIQGRGKGSQSKEIVLNTMKLSPDYQFCEYPEEIAGEFGAIIKATHEAHPDWQDIARRYRVIYALAPECFPIGNNLAGVLHALGQGKEAEMILRPIVEQHPEYYFARAQLLDMLMETRKMNEARELVRTTQIPSITHPAAWLEWQIATFRFWLAENEVQAALTCLDVIKTLCPDKERVRKLQMAIKGMKAFGTLMRQFGGARKNHRK